MLKEIDFLGSVEQFKTIARWFSKTRGYEEHPEIVYGVDNFPSSLSDLGDIQADFVYCVFEQEPQVKYEDTDLPKDPEHEKIVQIREQQHKDLVMRIIRAIMDKIGKTHRMQAKVFGYDFGDRTKLAIHCDIEHWVHFQDCWEGLVAELREHGLVNGPLVKLPSTGATSLLIENLSEMDRDRFELYKKITNAIKLGKRQMEACQLEGMDASTYRRWKKKFGNLYP